MKAGVITEEQLEEALRAQVVSGGRLGTLLIELGFVDEETLTQVLSEKFAVPRADAESLAAADPEAVRLLTEEVAQECRAIPFRREGHVLHVAMADPTNVEVLARLITSTEHPIRPHIAPEVRLYEALARHYGIPQESRYRTLAKRMGGPGQEGLGRRGPVTLEETERRLAEARDRDEIADAVVGYGIGAVGRIALFAFKGGCFKGWRAAGAGLSDERVQRIEIPDRVASIFQKIRETRSPYRGPIPDEPFTERIITLLGEPRPTEILVVPVFMLDRLVSALYADSGPSPLPAGAPEAFVRIARRMVDAFERLIVEARRITIQ